jgi:hypothetical protein
MDRDLVTCDEKRAQLNVSSTGRIQEAKRFLAQYPSCAASTKPQPVQPASKQMQGRLPSVGTF